MLRAVWDLRLKGDTDDAPVAVRPWFVEVLEEPEPHRMVALIGHNSVIVKQRIGNLLRVIGRRSWSTLTARRCGKLITSDFHANQRSLVEAIARRRASRWLDGQPGDGRAVDAEYPDTWLNLHGERGWSAKEFEKWFTQSARMLLLKGD